MCVSKDCHPSTPLRMAILTEKENKKAYKEIYRLFLDEVVESSVLQNYRLENFSKA